MPDKFGSLYDAWSEFGKDEVVKLILSENNTLLQSLTKNLNNMPELKALIRSIVMEDLRIGYNAQVDEIINLEMYVLIKNRNHSVCVANRIFGIKLYNLFASEERAGSKAGVYRGQNNMRGYALL